MGVETIVRKIRTMIMEVMEIVVLDFSPIVMCLVRIQRVNSTNVFYRLYCREYGETVE